MQASDVRIVNAFGGTPYTCTTIAAVDLGAATETLLLPSPGNWFMTGSVVFQYNAATITGTQKLKIVVGRVNNSPDENPVSYSYVEIPMGTRTLDTSTVMWPLPSLIYNTQNNDDLMSIYAGYGSVFNAPEAGTVTILGFQLIAMRCY